VEARQGAFTLIEMIGVLAVIAILAAVLVPKVFEAINNSRINSAALSCDTVKTAVIDHYAKFNGLNQDGSSGTAVTIPTLPDQAYDLMLLKEQFLDKPFITKIGDGTNGPVNTHIELITCPLTTATVDGTGTTGYNLSGTNTLNECNGSYLVQAVITGVSEADALALSQRMDGNTLSAPAVGNNDYAGRVKYTKGSPTVVYIYLTHR
jgi:prepilin-type N-terminal cleavage/methylation domain-containing protein